VLLRLPDVTQQLPAGARRSDHSPSGTFDYRFDPPQAAGVGGGGSPRQASAENARTRISASVSTRQPHVVERPTKTEPRRSATRRVSPILPQSDPFSTPSRSLSDSLAPLIRFLTLVALFAAAATWVQMLARRDAQMKSTRPPAEPTVQSAKNLPQSASPAPAANTTAAGPPNASHPSKVVTGTSSSASGPADTFFQVVSEGTPPAAAATAHDQPLPQIRTTTSPTNAAGAASARPPAIARLPGIIEAPRR
jgi:hypothetical protein